MHENEQRPLSHLTDAEVRAHLEAVRPVTQRTTRLNPLRDGFAEAGRAQLPVYQQGSGADARFIRLPGEAATMVRIDLASVLADLPQNDNVLTVNNKHAGNSLAVDPRAVIESRSVAIQSGAKLVLAHPRDDALVVAGQRTDGLYGLYRDAALVRRILPATFTDVADGASAPAQAIPTRDIQYSWPEAPSAAFSTTVTRAADRAVGGGDDLWSALLAAVLEGLAEYCDRAFFAAVNAAMGSTPPAFTFALAAAQHLQESDLRGVIGTTGTGAGYRGDGAFVTNPGVRALLSSQLSNTIIGAFGTGAIGLWPTIDVRISRLNTLGDATLTCFASAQGLVPDSNVFWTAAA